MEYLVVTNSCVRSLVEEVNSLILLGWSPLGGVSSSISPLKEVFNGSTCTYYKVQEQLWSQAMVHHGEVPPSVTNKQQVSDGTRNH